MDPATIGIAFSCSIFAGLSTGFGSLIAYFMRKPNLKYLAFSLGLSAGVMLYVSFVELLPEGMEAVGDGWGLLAFFIGIGLGALFDVILPEFDNSHHLKDCLACEEYDEETKSRKCKMMRTGVMTAIIIAIHNFPEGIATFGSALSDISLGLLVTIAIAIHNIPEGISVSIPIYYATGSRKKALQYSFISGLAEPLGATIGFLVLMPFLSEALLGSLLAFTAGVMIYIAVDELIPSAHGCGQGHEAIFGLCIGMGVMAVSIMLL